MTPLDALTVPLQGTRLIEASAGTGKTYAITNLYVRLLVESALPLSRILVVTYTNAATAELRGRIRQRLHDALRSIETGGSDDAFLDRFARRRAVQESSQDRARLLLALHSFDEAAIFTIHGFCQRMLQEHAFESGVPFDTELITDESPLVTEVVQDFWIRRLFEARELIDALTAEKLTLRALEDLAIRAIAQPDVPLLPTADDPTLQPGPGGMLSAPARCLALQLELAAYARRELRRRKERARWQSFDDLLYRVADALRGRGGAALAALMCGRYGAALIDEFQDTDPVQYEIFRRIYLGSSAPPPGTGTPALFLIGDPKQAIYAFRGADVFAYLQAKRDTGSDPYTLSVNQRSDPSLIAAVNALFGRLRSPFVLDGIPFLDAEAKPGADDCLGGTASGQPPLEILFVPRAGLPQKGGAILKTRGEAYVATQVAAEVARFLGSGATIDEAGAQRRVHPGDIAVLCRKNKQAIAMQQALRLLNVPSVLQGDSSVFDTPEAEEMERLLRALADPVDAHALRAALATSVLGQNAHDLLALEHDEQRWDAWVGLFQTCNERWVQRSFVAAFRMMLDVQQVPQRLLACVDGERRLTNLLHLMELLHAAAAEERRGPHALVTWLNQMRTETEARAALAGEGAQIRLESDAAAVTLTTVHKSKGLQYPIVYCPYLWDGALLSNADKATLRFHDPAAQDRLTFDLGSSKQDTHRVHAERELFAENLRLLYVALTRAQHRCSIVWGAFSKCETSALGYVLHQPADFQGDPRGATTQHIQALVAAGDGVMRAELAARAAVAPGSIAVNDLSPAPGTPCAPDSAAVPALHCRLATRALRRIWRVSSFSALASSSATISPPAEEGLDHDATTDASALRWRDAAVDLRAAPAGEQPLVLLHDFPSGARAGQLIHEVLEQIDFQTTDASALRPEVTATLARFGSEERWSEALCRALAEVVATPLSPKDMALQDVAPGRRLNELEFLFPVAAQIPPFEKGGQGGISARRVAAGKIPLGPPFSKRESKQLSLEYGDRMMLLTRDRLAAAFARHASAPLPSDYPDRLRALGFSPLTGFMKGFIDLVFVHGERWYLVDYKSNRLGVHAEDYRQPRLIEAMEEHHYFLQYHLYTVALHRYLGQRLEGYDYERHFGGVYYLFLRGMAPRHQSGTGIFYDRPAAALIEVGSSRVDLQACKLEYSIVSPK